MWFSDLSRSFHYDLQGAVAHPWVHCQWSYSWVGRILGLIIPTYLQRSYFLDMGRGQPENHLAEQFAISLHWLFPCTLYTLHSTVHTLHFTLYTPHFTFYTPHSTLYTPHSTLSTPHFTLHTTLHTPHFTRCRNLRLISTIFWKQFLTSTALAMAMVAFWYFFGSLHRPIPVRCSWSVFACKMHSTTEFAMTVLSTCVCVCGKWCSLLPCFGAAPKVCFAGKDNVCWLPAMVRTLTWPWALNSLVPPSYCIPQAVTAITWWHSFRPTPGFKCDQVWLGTGLFWVEFHSLAREAVEFCKVCGHNVHIDCQRQWASAGKHDTCPCLGTKMRTNFVSPLIPD